MKKLLKVFLAIVMVFSLLPVNYAGASETNDTNDENDGSVLCSIISEPDDLQNLIDTDVAYSSQDVITSEMSGTASPHKIVVKEEGWLFIKSFEKDNYTDCSLFSNFALTSKIAFGHRDEIVACYVQPGSYYYQINRWNGFEISTTTSYVGFMPASARIKVDKITYSKDMSKATVTFDYDEDYLKNFLDGTIRIVEGAVSYHDIEKDDIWKTDNRENALETNAFTATSNGTYTARIANADYFCMVTFEITDLVSSAPKAPKITSCKIGSKTISGTGLAGAKVNVIISGKAYSATIGSDKKWTVTIKTALKRGTKVKAYIKNAAGTKSKTTTVTVK